MSRDPNRASPEFSFKMAPRVLWFLVLVRCVLCEREQNYKNEGFFNSLSSGMKFAQNFISSESVAQKVAEFVVRAFQTTNRQTATRRPPIKEAYYEESPYSQDKYSEESRPGQVEAASPLSPLRQLVKLFGLQPSQISAVAVNALVFVAQMIATFLAGPKRQAESYRSDDPTSWILNKNSRHLQQLLETAKNESFSDILEDIIKEQGNEEETSCIRLLVCRVTPFVLKMQKVVFKDDSSKDLKIERQRGSAILYHHLPTENEINERSDICEKRHQACNLNE